MKKAFFAVGIMAVLTSATVGIIMPSTLAIHAFIGTMLATFGYLAICERG